jgi:hypothetical protein
VELCIESGGTNLVSWVACERADGAVDSAAGRVDVRLEGGGLIFVGRHDDVWWSWF